MLREEVSNEKTNPIPKAQAEDNRFLKHSPWNRFSCLQPGLDWTRLFMSLTAGAGTRCMSLLPTSPNHLVPVPLSGLPTRARHNERDRVREEEETEQKDLPTHFVSLIFIAR